MVPFPSSKDSEPLYGSVVDLLLKALDGLELEPRLIPPGRIDCLRGGVSCFELAGKDVDAAILLSTSGYENLYSRKYKSFFKVDYAVRGNIRGILPGRMVSKTALKLTGLVRKRIEELTWEIPSSDREMDTRRSGLGVHAEGVPPGPGELWEEGPHQKLIEILNRDYKLVESIIRFVERRRGRFLLLSIISDIWGESVRVHGNLWLKSQEFLDTYVTPPYLWIVDRIGRHIKELRRDFGGIAF